MMTICTRSYVYSVFFLINFIVHHLFCRSNIGDGILLAAAARGMVHSAISSTHHYCIEQIDRVRADVSLDCDDRGYRSDGDDAEELQRVGLS